MDNSGKGSRWKKKITISVPSPYELRVHELDQAHVGQPAGIAGSGVGNRDANGDLVAAASSVPESKEVGIADGAEEVIVIIFSIRIGVNSVEGSLSNDLHNGIRFGGGTGGSSRTDMLGL